MLFQDFMQAYVLPAAAMAERAWASPYLTGWWKRWGGEINVESRLGEGSRFVFEIPSPRCTEPDCGLADSPAREIYLPESSRILMAEDHLINRMVIEWLLAGSGASVDLVENGALAVARRTCQPYDITLTDRHMPEMDGFETTAAIRS